MTHFHSELKKYLRWSGFSSKQVFIKMGFHRMACSSNAQFHLVFKTVSRISVALLHQKLFMIWWEYSKVFKQWVLYISKHLQLYLKNTETKLFNKLGIKKGAESGVQKATCAKCY